MRAEGFRGALLPALIAVSMIVLMTSLMVPATSPLGPTFVLASPENTIVIVILHTNDIHSHLLPEYGQGGSAYIASIVDNEKGQHPGRVLLLDAGDIVDGDPVGDLFYGRSVIEVMNAIGYDAMTVGNHELGRYGGDYDYGVISIENDYLMDLEGVAEFPLLAANVRIDNSRPFESYVIKEIDNVKIGIIGATVYFPPPENVQILDHESAARECVEEIENQVDLIIALTHLGFNADKSLASNVENIDIIIGGHSHTVKWEPENVGDTKIVQAGAHGKYVGKIRLEFDAENHENYNFSYNLIEVKHPFLEENQGIAEMVENYDNIISPIVDVNIGYTENALSYPETGENVAESFRENTGADVGYQNSGGIRASIPAGPIIIRQIHKVLPYGNKLMSMDLRGDYLKGQFGYGYVAGAYEENSQWYLENGEPIEDDEYYRVATNEYSGTRYGFTNGENITYHGLCRDAFIDYVEEVFPAAATEFSLATLYKVGLDAKLYLENGSKLVVKFYTYGDIFENENVFWSGATPAHVKENEDVPHPSGIGVKKARLVLTTDDTENVIATVASFTVRKVDLEIRFTEIPLEWALASPAGKVALEIEFSQIPLYWALAPS